MQEHDMQWDFRCTEKNVKPGELRYHRTSPSNQEWSSVGSKHLPMRFIKVVPTQLENVPQV